MTLALDGYEIENMQAGGSEIMGNTKPAFRWFI